jgi:hypothetical protein
LIDERELAAVVRRHHAGGLSRPVSELIDRLTDHFLRITPLGIGWVHPSWRDLVIDELREGAEARRRFLSVSGVDDPHQALELDSLAVNVLGAIGRAGDEQHRPVPAFLLEAWYQLHAGVTEPVAQPQLAPTWVELHPGGLLLERPDHAELARTDEWLALAEVLRRYDPPALERFGFFSRDQDLLQRLIVTLTRTLADEDLRPLTESVLARIERLAPGLRRDAHAAREIGRLVDGLGRGRWWVPEDIAAPPTTEPAAAGASGFHREDIDRVLRDL